MSHIDKSWILAYYKLDFSIIPIQYKKKSPMPGIKKQKYHNTTPSITEIATWYKQLKFENIGVICGKVSDNLICFDFDNPKTFPKLGLDSQILIDLGAWVVETPRELGRYHVFFRSDEDVDFTNKYIYNKEIDMRGNKSIAVLYPSVHEVGKKYNLLNTHNPNKLKSPVKLPFKDILKSLNLKEEDI